MKLSFSTLYPKVKVKSAKKVILQENVWVEVDGVVYHFRDGEEFDGDSNPQVLWWVAPPVNEALLASMVHDRLYPLKGNRRRNDKVYFELSLLCGTKKYKAYMKYFMLRLFGWIPYLTYR